MSRSTWVALTVGFSSLALVAVAPSTMAAIRGGHGEGDRRPVQAAPVSSRSNTSKVVALSRVGDHGGGGHGNDNGDSHGNRNGNDNGHGEGNGNNGNHGNGNGEGNGNGNHGNGNGNHGNGNGNHGNGEGHDGHCSYPPSHSPQESLSARRHGNQVELHGASRYNGCGHGHREVALYKSRDGRHDWTLVTTTTADDQGDHVFTVPGGHHHAYYRAVVAGDNDYLPACSGVVEA